MSLSAHGIRAGYRGHPVLSEVSLTVAAGGTVGLRGPSGSGKSTLVRVLALLHPPVDGHVEVDGERVDGARHRVAADVRTKSGCCSRAPERPVTRG
ncbi:ATP-binding cassette domain-containing protein [Actinoplanes awajinensis]|uniref:ATP-binding cassette domain-containing protein n=1 Tax=Actinoplanes awajinensis TaxID=135946 RepID=UPI0022B5EF48|nr:ABC transporter ATP-binding protein [Actinoplanes awajinensis]